MHVRHFVLLALMTRDVFQEQEPLLVVVTFPYVCAGLKGNLKEAVSLHIALYACFLSIRHSNDRLRLFADSAAFEAGLFW